MSSVTANVLPRDDELVTAVTGIRQTQPTIGIAKLTALVKSQNPSWLISEKRLRKVLQQAAENEVESSSSKPEQDEIELVAQTGIDETIEWCEAPKVRVKMFGGVKGKGLVAKEKILMGEVIWQEEPWIVSPDP